MRYKDQYVILILDMIINYTGSLTLTGLEFPSHVMLGQPTNLKCSFTKEPTQKIDSIKWYKDGHEFYRLHPNIPINSENHRKQFQTAGVKIDYNSTLYSSSPQRGHHTVSLVDTKISTSGVYRCQITEAQAPFHTEQQDKNLTIIIQPEGGSPRLHVSKSVMSIGEQALVECWSDRSKPAADLQFFINGNRVPGEKVDDLEIFSESNGQLETSYRRMRLTLRDNHLLANSLVVKCNANIGEAYWQTTDAVIQVIGKPSYMLHSRSSSYSEIGKSRTISLLISFLFMCSTRKSDY